MRPDIVAEARGWIGTPYRHGGASRLGCDCLGLVAGVVGALTGEREAIPHYAPDWAEATGRELLQEALDARLARRDSLTRQDVSAERRDAGVSPPPCGEEYEVGVGAARCPVCTIELDADEPPPCIPPHKGEGGPGRRASCDADEPCPPHPIRLPPAGTFPSFVGKAFWPGDILLFRWRPHRPAAHLGIATSPETMVHAHARAAVAEVSLGAAWRRRIAAVYRLPEIP